MLRGGGSPTAPGAGREACMGGLCCARKVACHAACAGCNYSIDRCAARTKIRGQLDVITCACIACIVQSRSGYVFGILVRASPPATKCANALCLLLGTRVSSSDAALPEPHGELLVVYLPVPINVGLLHNFIDLLF